MMHAAWIGYYRDQGIAVAMGTWGGTTLDSVPPDYLACVETLEAISC